MLATARLFLFLGALNAALAVGLGAFGAHVLKARLSAPLLQTYQTGATYHFYHALGLLIAAILLARQPSSLLLRGAGWLLFAGIVLFSGSLYALSLSGIRGFGAITPFGGTAFILGWLLMAFASLRFRADGSTGM